MNRKIITLVAAGALAVAALGGGIATAGSGDTDQESDVPITGAALEQASAAALEHVGGGEVTDTEIEDEESYYEVEVTIDGREIDVQLDEAFNVVGTEEEDADESDD